ncbi:MAG: DegT/DnrJ/EryC1/StrS family aminotransferase, partial [Pirellula sp.]
MPVSRGSVHHPLKEDFFNSVRSIALPGSTARRASAAERSAVQDRLLRKFGFENVVLFPFARSAFHALLRSLDLPINSEILMTPITIGPMLEVVTDLGYRPVFVDIELETFSVNLIDLEEKLKGRPACFLLTYLFGYVPDIERISELCRRADIPLIEDISQNIGATFGGQALGSFGCAAIYSASLFKYVDSYNGAFAATKDRSLAQRLEQEAATYSEPDSRRVGRIIRRSLAWNVLLRRVPFSVFVFPSLWILKWVNREKLDSLLGAKIGYAARAELP